MCPVDLQNNPFDCHIDAVEFLIKDWCGERERSVRYWGRREGLDARGVRYRGCYVQGC